jgi:hypothetical protein
MSTMVDPRDMPRLDNIVARIRVGQQWAWSDQRTTHLVAKMPRRVQIIGIDLPGYAVLVNGDKRVLHPNVFVDGTYCLLNESDVVLRTPYQIVYRTMPAFSIPQPSAWLIGKGIMRLNNAPYGPPSELLNRRVWLHAGVVDSASYATVKELGIEDYPESQAGLETESIIGSVVIDRAVDYIPSPWFRGPMGWVLSDPLPLPSSIKCKGRDGFWTPEFYRAP